MRQNIFHAEKLDNYSVISNLMVRDTKLSFAARGLLTYLLTMKKEWIVNTSHLIKQSPLGRDGVHSLLQELERFGYLYREQSLQEHKHFGPTTILIYESPELNPHFSPHTASPYTVEPYTEEPCTAKPQLRNTKKEIITKKKEILNTQEGADAPRAKYSFSDPDLQAVLDLYKNLFCKYYGFTPIVGSPKDKKNLTRLIGLYGSGAIQKCIRAYFELENPFVATEAKHSLNFFYSKHFNSLFAAVSENEQRAKKIKSGMDGVDGYDDILADIKKRRPKLQDQHDGVNLKV